MDFDHFEVAWSACWYRSLRRRFLRELVQFKPAPASRES
jgi:hypothetical protein